jgi:hypothetical protein
MTTGYSVPLRNAQLDAITALAGNGAKLRIYSGTRPATGGAATTLLAEFTLGTPFAPAAAGGVLSPNIPASVIASAAGQATWFRIVKADGTTLVMDGSAGLASDTPVPDMVLSIEPLPSGVALTILGFTITRANA